MKIKFNSLLLLVVLIIVSSCKVKTSSQKDDVSKNNSSDPTTYPYTFKAENNPIIKHLRTADPDCHVWADGKMWMYTSQDHDPIPGGGPGYDKMDGYHAFSSEDLITWTDHGEIFHSRDSNWGIDGGGWLWAPGVAFKNNKYYLYYPHKDKNKNWRVGVAISKKPQGPFIDTGKYIEGTHGIDPMCFIDDDGEAYLYFDHSVAKLKPNMMELAEKERIIEYGANDKKETNEDMVEAPWMYKRNGIYYFSYSNYKNKEYQGFYGMGKSPYGPFEWKGAVNRNPPGAQDHHSIVEFKNKWYYFYHTGNYTNDKGEKGRGNRRTICLDYLYHNEDGTMKLVEQTTNSIYSK
jgi:arabinoxylan arabinofuranohydrolase